MWGAGDRSDPPLISQLAPRVAGALEGLATFQPSREEPGEGGCCFQAETLLLGVVPIEQHLWKEWAEQGRGKNSAKSRWMLGSSLYKNMEPTDSSKLHSSERESSPVTVELWPPCCGSTEKITGKKQLDKFSREIGRS